MSQFQQYQAWKKWNDKSFGQCDRLSAAYFSAEFKTAGVDTKKRGAIVEIGFGNGIFAAWIRNLGWDYAGTEMDVNLVARANDFGISAYMADTPFEVLAAEKTLDVVIALDVLEHMTLDGVTALLSRARRFLKPDGRFIARFPSGDSPFSGAIQYGDVTHCSIIGSGIVQQLCIACGYRAVQIRAPALPLKGVGSARFVRRLLVRTSRAVTGALLRVVFYDNEDKVLAPNMLIVLQPNVDEAS